MKKYLLLGLIATTSIFTSCSDDETDNIGNDAVEYDYKPILTDYVNNAIIPTYGEMKDNAKLLLESVKNFETSNAQSDVDAACEYWKKTRAPWEAGEAFLFGPAAFNNLDPLLDSWPLDRAQLDQVLASDQTLTSDFVKNGLGAVLRGFHTVEYLLFVDGSPKQAASFTDREKEYLSAVSEVLRDDCILLWAQWDGGASEAAILESLDIEVSDPYGVEFRTAGEPGSRYLSQTDAVDEILQGMIAIADEVAHGKISEPHTSGEVLDVESWFSWNSLTDFTNNIKSIENSYLGGYNTREHSISEFVKLQDEAIDLKVKDKIKNAIDAIASIPQPFRNNLKHANVTVAIAKVAELMDVLDSEVRPLIVN